MHVIKVMKTCFSLSQVTVPANERHHISEESPSGVMPPILHITRPGGVTCLHINNYTVCDL